MFLTPFLEPVESRFDQKKSLLWLQKYRWFSIYMSTVYLILIFIGKRWMRGKPAFSLRRPLTMWNTGLAVFSIIGFLTEFPVLAENIIKNGFSRAVCYKHTEGTADFHLWTLLFALSKTVELGDTVFVILRKTPLNFLHWYHHITVYIYCTWLTGRDTGVPALGVWFGITNFFIHSIMYSYYTLKAAGFKVPRVIPQIITTLQLAQFVLGVVTTCTAFMVKINGGECDIPFGFLYGGLAMYVSYFVLFFNFFCRRYVFN